MHITKFAAILLGVVFCQPCLAQDKIYRKDGTVVESKVKNIGVRTLTYLRFDNQGGPEYVVPKNEVEKVVYQNGTIEDFAGDPRAHRHHHLATEGPAVPITYRPNVIAVAPIQFSENGLGASLSYERALDKRGIVAVYVPVMLTLHLNGGTYYDQNSATYKNMHQDLMYYVMPGVKIYPTGSFGAVRYAIGPSIVAASGEKTEMTTLTPYASTTQPVTYTHTLVGVMLNNSLNINPNPRIYVGIEFGFGFTYYNRVNDLNEGSNGLVQGSFKIGYRF